MKIYELCYICNKKLYMGINKFLIKVKARLKLKSQDVLSMTRNQMFSY